VLSAGHDEYWSAGQRRAWDGALARSTNIAAMGANNAYWEVRYGAVRRTIERVDQFRALEPARPECRLFGVMTAYNAQRPAGFPPTPYSLAASPRDPWVAGTGLTRADDVPGVVGYEWDTLSAGCFPGRVTRLLRASPSGEDGKPHPADAVRGVATRSGARMFAAGSIQFAWGLDGYGNHLPSRRLQLLMEKALSDMTRPAPPRPLTVDAATGRLRARRPAAAAIGGATGQARSATRRCPSTAGALRRRPSQPGADPTDHVWDSSSLGTSPITTV
jgi:hypothetical protein